MASYTLVLSRGMYFLDEAAGTTVLDAMANGETSVVVDADILGDGFKRAGVRLAIAHVIAVIPNDDERGDPNTIPFGPNVTALRPLRQAH
jgi:hypothetical protein